MTGPELDRHGAGLTFEAPSTSPVVVFVDGAVCGREALVGDRWAGGWQMRRVGDRWTIATGGHDEAQLSIRPEVHATGLVAACAGRAIGAFGGGVSLDTYVAAIDVFERRTLGPVASDGALIAALEAIAHAHHAGPIVVVLAMSTWTLPPLGRSPVELAIDRLTQRPGAYVVCAAGNHRQAARHAKLAAGTSWLRVIRSPGAERVRMAFHTPGAVIGDVITVRDATHTPLSLDMMGSVPGDDVCVAEVTARTPTTHLHVQASMEVAAWCLDGGAFHPEDATPRDTIGVPASATAAIRIGALSERGPEPARRLAASGVGGPLTGRVDAVAGGHDIAVPTRDGAGRVSGTSIAAAQAAGTIARALAARRSAAPPISALVLRRLLRETSLPLRDDGDVHGGGWLSAARLTRAVRNHNVGADDNDGSGRPL